MGKVITFSNQKGGSGKSTLSANLAVLWSNSGYKVAVIDADPQKSLTYWLSERKKYYGDDDIGINFYNFDIRNLTEEVKKIKRKYDFIIITVGHSIFLQLGFKKVRQFLKENGKIYDVKSIFDKADTDYRL